MTDEREFQSGITPEWLKGELDRRDELIRQSIRQDILHGSWSIDDSFSAEALAGDQQRGDEDFDPLTRPDHWRVAMWVCIALCAGAVFVHGVSVIIRSFVTP